MPRHHSRSPAYLVVVLGTLLAALSLQLAQASDLERPDIPGVTRPTSSPTATLAIRSSASDDDKQCNPAQPDACAAVDFLAIQHEDAAYGQNFGKRQEEEETSSRVVNVPQNAPNGGLSMTQPPITAQATFYKIAESNYITFGWQFTDVLVQPETLTLQAFCSQNGFTYPVGPTQGIAGDTTEYAWNPYDYEQAGGATPLAEASYTLRIFDERGYFAAPSAGYMRPYAGTVFALYRPQKYVGLQDGWVCAACSAAWRSIPVHPAILATTMSLFAGAWIVFARIQ